jgi:processive 1,2-diacylglycerol beta-glucosyltransferase
MSKRKILLLSVSAGAGHMRAAEALHCCAQLHFPEAQTVHLDVMQHVASGFRKAYTDWYIQLVNASPSAWGLLYQASNRADPQAPGQKLRRAVERLNTRPLLQAIAQFGPDALICTHFLPAEVLMHEKRRQRIAAPVWVQVTDFDLHRMWVMPEMQGYFAANDEIAARMQSRVPAPSTIHTTGIPVMPAFAQQRDPVAAASVFGLDPARPVIVLMGGGAGLGGLDGLARSLLAIEQDFQLVVLAGKNESVLLALKALADQHPGRLFSLGFTDQVDQLMACASFVITKPGGLTASECLAMGVPMVLTSPIPGQEERNADYLLEQGVALKAMDEPALVWRVRHLLANPQLLADMRGKAAAIGRPHAARAVLQTVLDGLSQR